MKLQAIHTHLDGWVGFSGVVALLTRNAPSRTALTLVPEPHPPLLGLLDDLYEGTRCPAERRILIQIGGPTGTEFHVYSWAARDCADVIYGKQRPTCAE